MGPFSNPSETYQYYDLPFCAPPSKDNKLLTLGEVSLAVAAAAGGQRHRGRRAGTPQTSWVVG